MMSKRFIIVPSITNMLAYSVSSAIAIDKKLVQQQQKAQEQVYGWELMTPEERVEHRAQMRSLQNEEEQRVFQLEHHQRMLKRAKEEGLALPDVLRTQRGGMGPSVDRAGGRGCDRGGPR